MVQVPVIRAGDLPGSHNPSSDATPADAPLLSVIICTLDEHEAIGGVLRELDAELLGVGHEIIVVDDSTDERTGDVVNAYAATNPHVRLVRRYKASGLSSAAINGWDVAKGSFLAIMDGDGQHDPALMKALLGTFDDPTIDVAVASRYLDDARSGLSGVRHTLSRAGTWLTDTTLGVPLADPLSGCFAMTRDWYSQVRSQLSGLGFKILIDVVASGQRRPHTAQVPTLLRERAGGTSKLDTRVVIDLLTLLVEKRSRGKITAKAIMTGIGVIATLLAQWLSMGVLMKAGVSLWLAVLLSVGFGLAGRLAMAHLMTSRSLRSRTLGDACKLWLGFYASRWTDILLNAGVTFVLCKIGCPWAVAALIGVLLAEARYHTGKIAGASA
jgi:dolichol-phosphate mannosyltransferase